MDGEKVIDKKGSWKEIGIFVLVLFVMFTSFVFADNQNNLEETIQKSVLEFNEGPVNKILIQNVVEKEIDFKIKNVDEKLISEKEFVKVYEINTNGLDFENAKASVTAKGNNLYQCGNWDFEVSQCLGQWDFVMEITPGKDYVFDIPNNGGGFGEEINITDAVHLDENYEFINNIYDEVYLLDDVWSEPIYENEYVRATFERDLTNGRVIDVYATADGTLAYFEIYEAGTDNLVGKSGIFEGTEYQYMEVRDLSEPTDTFDFKIVKVIGDEEEYEECLELCYDDCSEDPYEECEDECELECDSIIYDVDREAFLRFDFIHDDAYNSTHADGVLGYEQRDSATPKFRTWNESANFSVEQNALPVGSDTVNDITWTVVKSCPERDEMIMGTLDKDLNITIQIYNESEDWENLQGMTDATESSTYREFDIAYEGLSGDALIVYENSGDAANNLVAYRTWNGASYSSEATLNTGLANGEIRWVALTSKTYSDEIMLMVHNDIGDLHAYPWNGTDFDSTKNLTLSEGTTSSAEQHFAFEWEYSSGEGFGIYGEGNDLQYRTYDPDDPLQNYWGSEINLGGFGNGIDAARLCSDTSSDYIGIIFQDAGNDINVRVWNGTDLLGSPPSQDGGSEANGANNVNVDCAWYNSTTALFGFVDSNALSIDYFNFTKPNTWGTTALTSTANSGNFAADDIKGMRFTEHPSTEEVMVIAQDIGEDVRAIRWNGTNFVTPNASVLESLTEVVNGAQESAMFAWFKYDSKPNVTSVNPSGVNYAVSASVEINASITDNIGIDTVLANVTLPNNSISQLTLLDSNSDEIYNGTFTITDNIGSYTIRIIANDTGNNVNSSETANFNVVDSNNPNVTALLPVNGTSFNATVTIEISANVTDDVNISTVLANITYPNETINQIVLSNDTFANKFNNSFTLPKLLGTYNITFIANDTGNNVNSSEETNFTVVDNIKPAVTALIPLINSQFNVSNKIEISANVSDEVSIDTILANISYPNGTINQLTLSNNTFANKFNNTFTVPSLTGNYNVTIIANDTSNNLNLTEKSNFTVSDVTALTITILGCRPPNANLTQSVECNASVVDDVGVDTVKANVTLPNGTVLVQTLSNVSSNYNFTFTNTNLNVGQYNVTWWANDTGNNPDTATDSFNVSDVTAMGITLHSPANNSNTSSSSVVFNFTASENFYSTFNCSLILDGTINKTNLTTANATVTTFTVLSVADGSHWWNITCSDDSSNSNTSETRNFTVDTFYPNFISLTYNPNATNSVDPGVNITVFANITDNTTKVESVVFQRKLSNESNYTNLTMVWDGSLYYNATFNATINGTYNLRVWANDSAGNANYSNLVNIDVQLDNTWTRSPLTFTPINTNLNTNVTLGNLTINNTGDYSLDFNITSSSLNTVLNFSSNFTLAAGGVRIISVNDSTSSAGVTTITLNISAVPSNILEIASANPTLLTTTGNLIVAAGQPVLVATFTTPSGDTKTVTQGDTGVEFTAKLENIGEGNASNGTFYFTLPSGWTVTLGEINESFDELLSGDDIEKTIEITIPSDATIGSHMVYINATGVNATGFDLVAEGLVFGDSVNVTVSSAANLGSGGGSGPGSGTGSGSGGGGGGGGGGTVLRSGEGETLYTIETYTVVRGDEAEIPITVTNHYENAYFEDVQIQVQGFMSQYVEIMEIYNPNKIVYSDSHSIKISEEDDPQTIDLKNIGIHFVDIAKINSNSVSLIITSEPVDLELFINETKNVDINGDGYDDIAVNLKNIVGDEVDLLIHKLGLSELEKIYFSEEREYLIEIFVPPYLQEEDYNLTLLINGKIIPLNPARAGFDYRPFTEYRTLLFKVLPLGSEDVEDELEKAREAIEEMESAGFPVERVNSLLEKAEKALAEESYSTALVLAEDIVESKTFAFKANEIIEGLVKDIERAKEKWLDLPESERALALAQKAFEREDFETALERAKEAQLIYVLETKGRINILWFLSQYWWVLIMGAVVFAVIAFFSYKIFVVHIINQRLKNLAKEEVGLKKLREEAQFKHLKEGSISSTEYHRLMAQYESRLNKIHHLQIKLRHKKVGIIKTEQEIENLTKEEKDLIDSMKQEQDAYLRTGRLTRKQFLEKYEFDRSRFAEVEHQKELLKEKLEVEKISRKYRFLSAVNGLFVKLSGLFKRDKKTDALKELDRELGTKSDKIGRKYGFSLGINKLFVKISGLFKRDEKIKVSGKLDRELEKKDDSKLVKEKIREIKRDRPPVKPVGGIKKVYDEKKFSRWDNERRRAKKNRKKVYKMLKEEYGLDVGDEDDEK